MRQTILRAPLVTMWACGCLAMAASSIALADSKDDWERMKKITPRGYVCGVADKPLAIDGKLDEAAWQAAPWTDDFVDIEGDAKPKPKHRTRAKMLWDKDYFYIAAELTEPHVWGTLTKHDAVIFQDNDFEVFIDPDGDNHEYYELELNALNTTWDLYLPKPYKDGGGADNNWEIPGMKTAVHIRGTLNDPKDEDSGWSVEIALPWSVLAKQAHRAAPPKNGDQWRVDFSRVEWQHVVEDGKYKKVPNTKEDNWVWSPQGIIDMHRPERWGFVQFTTEPPGRMKYAPDGSLAARDRLMEVYHRQKSFQGAQKRFAESLKELGFEPAATKELAEPLVMKLTQDGFEATQTVTLAGGKKQTWHVRQDSRLWRDTDDDQINAALERAGENRSEIEKSLADTPAAHQKALRFLVENMPDRDLRELKADFLVENVRLAYEALEASPWKTAIPEEIFFNDVLPYASINERRDAWRKDFHDRFMPLVKDCKTPAAAAALLNQKIFALFKVKYSTERRRADQSPYESINSGLASCTGLSVLLIDACRSVGVPARFAGTPLWSDMSGNHSWVEVWDNGWHFTGAAEPAGDRLDEVWFMGRAAGAKRDDPRNAIYATSFRKTPQTFPLVFARGVNYVYAVNVTDRYVNRAAKPPEGSILTMFAVRDDLLGGDRCAADIKITGADGKQFFAGRTKDERFDANDHVTVYLPKGQAYEAEIKHGDRVIKKKFQTSDRDQTLIWNVDDKPPAETPGKTSAAANGSPEALVALKKYLAEPADKRPAIADQAFAKVALSRDEAKEAAKLLWDDHAQRIRQTREAEMKAKEIVIGNLKMPFTYQLFGEKPATGRSLYISMHGGGGAPKRVNDQQWENQKRLYKLDEGVYLVPRAPTDTWNLWHEGHIDEFFTRLIENLIVLEEVNPDRVYIMGYSAGGDGVFQLAPRMADQLGAAAMMAGHPNETSPLGLRNLPFTLHMGANDAAYSRNKVAAEWKDKLAALQKDDPAGYVHSVTLHEGKGHWMDRQDAVALPWMAKHARNRYPEKIVWKQDDVVHTRFYWLAAAKEDVRDRAEVVATHDKQQFNISGKDIDRLTVRLCDDLANLDEPIIVTSGDKKLFEGKVPRTIATLAKTLAERGDPKAMFSGEVTVDLASSVKQ